MGEIVKSESECGCAVACMATVLERTYTKVVKDFEVDFDEEGLTTDTVKDYLIEQGKSIFYKEASSFKHDDFMRNELLTPFAPIHILIVQIKFDSEDNHMVIMDDKGKIYCP